MEMIEAIIRLLDGVSFEPLNHYCLPGVNLKLVTPSTQINKSYFQRGLYYQLFGQNLGHKGFESVEEKMETDKHLLGMILFANQLVSQSASILRRILIKQTQLMFLNLAHNRLGDEGVILLFEAVKKHQSLRHLDVSYNCLTDKVLPRLASVFLQNELLHYVNCKGNGLTYAGAIEMRQYLAGRKSHLVIKGLEAGHDAEPEEGCSLA